MFILGIDPSSKFIAMVGKDDITRTMVMEKYDLREGVKGNAYQPMVAANALDCVWAFLESVSSPHRIAYLEEPVIGRGGAKSSIVQSYVNGVIQAALTKGGFDVELVNVQRWKRHVCGAGNADKGSVSQAVAAHWPKAHRAAQGDQDLIDACAITIYGEQKQRLERAIGKGASLDL